MAAGLACALLSAPVAAAADVTVSGQVAPGHFSVSSPKSRSVTAKRRAHAAAVLTLPFVVTDTRGTGAGWTLSATTSSKLHVVLRSIEVTCAGCTRPRNAVEYPLALRRGRPTAFFRARKRSGMGVMHLSAHLGLTAPKRGGRYSVALRIAHTAGP